MTDAFEGEQGAVTLYDVERSLRALDVLSSLGDTCTCDRTAIERCPNYQPGDEAPDAFEEDE